MSDEEPRSQSQSQYAFSHKGALHNLLGVPDEARTQVSYARTAPPVEFLYPTPRLVDDEETADDDESFSRAMTTEPHHAAERPAQFVSGARQPFEHQLDASVVPKNRRRQDPSAEEVISISAPARMVPAAAPGRQNGRAAIKAEEGEPVPRMNQARESLARGPSSLRPAVERPAHVPGVAHEKSSGPEKRAAAGAEPALTRDRGVEQRRHTEYAAGGDSAAIEHLRRTVQELTAKMAQSHGRTPQPATVAQLDTTPATAPPAVPQRAVISPDERWRRPSGRAGRSGPARLFWQRNYLTRRGL